MTSPVVELKCRQCPFCNRGVLTGLVKIGGAFEGGQLTRKYVNWSCERCHRKGQIGWIKVESTRHPKDVVE